MNTVTAIQHSAPMCGGSLVMSQYSLRWVNNPPKKENAPRSRIADQENKRVVCIEHNRLLSRPRHRRCHDGGCSRCSFRACLIHVDERLMDRRRNMEPGLACHAGEIGRVEECLRHSHLCERLAQLELLRKCEPRQAQNYVVLVMELPEPLVQRAGGHRLLERGQASRHFRQQDHHCEVAVEVPQLERLERAAITVFVFAGSMHEQRLHRLRSGWM